MSDPLISFPADDAFREAITIAAKNQGISRAELIRTAVAAAIDYDLPRQKKGRPRTYASEAERKKAQRERQKEERDIQKRIIQMIRSGERQEDIKALLDSIDNKIKK